MQPKDMQPKERSGNEGIDEINNDYMLLELIIDHHIRRKCVAERHFDKEKISRNKFLYVDNLGYVIIYDIIEACNSYLINELEEVEKNVIGICNVSVYSIDAEDMTMKRIDDPSEFEDGDSLHAQAKAARFMESLRPD